MMDLDRPKFDKPPINEVAIGVRFEPIEGFLPSHFGLFWSSVRKEFGTSENAPPMDLNSVDKWGLPLQRVWLVHNDDQYLIQLQANVFYFNWRRRNEAQDYPSFSKIRPLFNRYWEQYCEFLAREGLSPPAAVAGDLTYVNVFKPDELLQFSNGFNGLLRDVNWRPENERQTPLPKTISWQEVTELAEDHVQLTTKTQTARRASDSRDVLRLEIGAKDTRSFSAWDETAAWFEIAHQTIIMSFLDMTTDEAQRELWKRVDDRDS